MDDNFGCTIATIVILLAVAIVGYAIHDSRKDRKKHDETCKSILAMARTNTDSINIRMKCELREDKTTVVPVVTPVYTR